MLLDTQQLFPRVLLRFHQVSLRRLSQMAERGDRRIRQGVLLVFGAALLVLLVITAAAIQAGELQCIACDGNICSTSYGTQICPASSAAALAIGAGLAVAAIIVGLGLTSPSVVDGRQNSGIRTTPTRLFEFATSFSTFLGWGLFFWGLLLPWNVFGTCYYGPCAYPYQLGGFPLALVITGGFLLCMGISLIFHTARSRPLAKPDE
jgi:hypothetical protein